MAQATTEKTLLKHTTDSIKQKATDSYKNSRGKEREQMISGVSTSNYKLTTLPRADLNLSLSTVSKDKTKKLNTNQKTVSTRALSARKYPNAQGPERTKRNTMKKRANTALLRTQKRPRSLRLVMRRLLKRKEKLLAQRTRKLLSKRKKVTKLRYSINFRSPLSTSNENSSWSLNQTHVTKKGKSRLAASMLSKTWRKMPKQSKTLIKTWGLEYLKQLRGRRKTQRLRLRSFLRVATANMQVEHQARTYNHIAAQGTRCIREQSKGRGLVSNLSVKGGQMGEIVRLKRRVAHQAIATRRRPVYIAHNLQSNTSRFYNIQSQTAYMDKLANPLSVKSWSHRAVKQRHRNLLNASRVVQARLNAVFRKRLVNSATERKTQLNKFAHRVTLLASPRTRTRKAYYYKLFTNHLASRNTQTSLLRSYGRMWRRRNASVSRPHGKLLASNIHYLPSPKTVGNDFGWDARTQEQHLRHRSLHHLQLRRSRDRHVTYKKALDNRLNERLLTQTVGRRVRLDRTTRPYLTLAYQMRKRRWHHPRRSWQSFDPAPTFVPTHQHLSWWNLAINKPRLKEELKPRKFQDFAFNVLRARYGQIVPGYKRRRRVILNKLNTNRWWRPTSVATPVLHPYTTTTFSSPIGGSVRRNLYARAKTRSRNFEIDVNDELHTKYNTWRNNNWRLLLSDSNNPFLWGWPEKAIIRLVENHPLWAVFTTTLEQSIAAVLKEYFITESRTWLAARDKETLTYSQAALSSTFVTKTELVTFSRYAFLQREPNWWLTEASRRLNLLQQVVTAQGSANMSAQNMFNVYQQLAMSTEAVQATALFHQEKSLMSLALGFTVGADSSTTPNEIAAAPLTPTAHQSKPYQLWLQGASGHLKSTLFQQSSRASSTDEKGAVTKLVLNSSRFPAAGRRQGSYDNAVQAFYNKTLYPQYRRVQHFKFTKMKPVTTRAPFTVEGQHTTTPALRVKQKLATSVNRVRYYSRRWRALLHKRMRKSLAENTLLHTPYNESYGKISSTKRRFLATPVRAIAKAQRRVRLQHNGVRHSLEAETLLGNALQQRRNSRQITELLSAVRRRRLPQDQIKPLWVRQRAARWQANKRRHAATVKHASRSGNGHWRVGNYSSVTGQLLWAHKAGKIVVSRPTPYRTVPSDALLSVVKVLPKGEFERRAWAKHGWTPAHTSTSSHMQALIFNTRAKFDAERSAEERYTTKKNRWLSKQLRLRGKKPDFLPWYLKTRPKAIRVTRVSAQTRWEKALGRSADRRTVLSRRSVRKLSYASLTQRYYGRVRPQARRFAAKVRRSSRRYKSFTNRFKWNKKKSRRLASLYIRKSVLRERKVRLASRSAYQTGSHVNSALLSRRMIFNRNQGRTSLQSRAGLRSKLRALAPVKKIPESSTPVYKIYQAKATRARKGLRISKKVTRRVAYSSQYVTANKQQLARVTPFGMYVRKGALKNKKALRKVSTHVAATLVDKHASAANSTFMKLQEIAAAKSPLTVPFSFTLPTQVRHVSSEEKKRRARAVWERKKEKYRETSQLTSIFTKLFPQIIQFLLEQKDQNGLRTYAEIRNAVTAVYWSLRFYLRHDFHNLRIEERDTKIKNLQRLRGEVVSLAEELTPTDANIAAMRYRFQKQAFARRRELSRGAINWLRMFFPKRYSLYLEDPEHYNTLALPANKVLRSHPSRNFPGYRRTYSLANTPEQQARRLKKFVSSDTSARFENALATSRRTMPQFNSKPHSTVGTRLGKATAPSFFNRSFSTSARTTIADRVNLQRRAVVLKDRAISDAAVNVAHRTVKLRVYQKGLKSYASVGATTSFLDPRLTRAKSIRNKQFIVRASATLPTPRVMTMLSALRQRAASTLPSSAKLARTKMHRPSSFQLKRSKPGVHLPALQLRRALDNSAPYRLYSPVKYSVLRARATASTRPTTGAPISNGNSPVLLNRAQLRRNPVTPRAHAMVALRSVRLSTPAKRLAHRFIVPTLRPRYAVYKTKELLNRVRKGPRMSFASTRWSLQKIATQKTGVKVTSKSTFRPRKFAAMATTNSSTQLRLKDWLRDRRYRNTVSPDTASRNRVWDAITLRWRKKERILKKWLKVVKLYLKRKDIDWSLLSQPAYKQMRRRLRKLEWREPDRHFNRPGWRYAFALHPKERRRIPWLQPMLFRRSLYSTRRHTYRRYQFPREQKRLSWLQHARTALYAPRGKKAYIKNRRWPRLRIYNNRMFRSFFHLRSKRVAARHFKKLSRRSVRTNSFSHSLEGLANRLDVTLLLMKLAPTVFWARLIARLGLCTVNGQTVTDASYRLQAGDRLTWDAARLQQVSANFQPYVPPHVAKRQPKVPRITMFPKNITYFPGVRIAIYKGLPCAEDLRRNSRLNPLLFSLFKTSTRS